MQLATYSQDTRFIGADHTERMLSRLSSILKFILFKKKKKAYRRAFHRLYRRFTEIACTIATALKLNWAFAYYFKGQQLSNSYYWLRGSPGTKIERIDAIGERAVDFLRKSVEIDPNHLDVYNDLSQLLFSMGDALECIDVAARMQSRKYRIAEALEFVNPAFVIGSIGLYENLDAWIKAASLGLRKAGKPILLLPKHWKINNKAYFDYWKPHLSIVGDAQAIRLLSPLQKYITPLSGSTLTINHRTLYNYDAYGVIKKKWREQGRAPLLTISDRDFERGWKRLESMGVPQGAWFVALHVREAGWRGNNPYPEKFRNADINTYIPAIRKIVDAGGWVVRMGDPSSMTPLPPMNQVIDYAHSEAKSDWMDVFCCAQCRFLIGTASGLYTISEAFGVPVVMTNCLPTYALYTLDPQDLFLPRLCRSRKDHRYLTFEESFSPPVSIANSQFLYEKLGLDVIPNTSAEIEDVVLEMMARLDGDHIEDTAATRLQKRFNAVTAYCRTLHGNDSIGINANIGERFLRKYEHLIHGAQNAPFHPI